MSNMASESTHPRGGREQTKRKAVSAGKTLLFVDLDSQFLPFRTTRLRQHLRFNQRERSVSVTHAMFIQLDAVVLGFFLWPKKFANVPECSGHCRNPPGGCVWSPSFSLPPRSVSSKKSAFGGSWCCLDFFHFCEETIDKCQSLDCRLIGNRFICKFGFDSPNLLLDSQVSVV